MNIQTDKNNKAILSWFMGGTFILLFALLYILIYFAFYTNVPASNKPSSKNIHIRPGMNARNVSYLLGKKGVIVKPRLFSYLAWLKGDSNHLKAGEYLLSPTMTPLEILKIITTGRIILHPVTIPEGYNFLEIAEVFSKKNLVNKKEFLSLTKNKNLIDYLGVDVVSLEGYLFPDTYYFNKGLSSKDIIKKMINTYKKNITPSMQKKMSKIGFTENQIVTLASLIEKETGMAQERRLISGVFHNRLRKNMKLQCDPTVIYALGEKFDGNIRRKDLFFDSPYNTYRYRGLPPGPIASPGFKSILAAIYPEDVNYFYFVAKKDGSHQFSSTLKKHNRAVRKYQLNRRRRSRKNN